MPRYSRTIAIVFGSLACLAAHSSLAQDWPQWRGPNRDAKAAGFEAPATWPAELTQKWSIEIGESVSSPALVGDRLYVFSRQGGNEIVRCLNADTGDEIWRDEYPAAEVTTSANRFEANPHGPRSSPAVSDGKVVTLGVQEILSCYNAATGELLWRVDEFEGDGPQFYISSSPIVVDGMCIAQLGGEQSGNGFVIAYDLATGEEKWRWQGEKPAYGSPAVMAINGTKAIIAPVERNLVAIDASSGALLWKIQYSQGRYNAASPIVDGQTLIIGPGTSITAMQLTKDGSQLSADTLWNQTGNSIDNNTPVLKDGLLFGLSGQNQLFCLNTGTRETTWTVSTAGEVQEPASSDDAGREQGRGGRGRGGRRGGGRAYGAIVDAGPVMMALVPDGQLIVYEPSGAEYKELARYKVSDGGTYAYPVVSGSRIFIKDQDSVSLWTIN